MCPSLSRGGLCSPSCCRNIPAHPGCRDPSSAWNAHLEGPDSIPGSIPRAAPQNSGVFFRAVPTWQTHPSLIYWAADLGKGPAAGGESQSSSLCLALCPLQNRSPALLGRTASPLQSKYLKALFSSSATPNSLLQSMGNHLISDSSIKSKLIAHVRDLV